MFTHQAGLAFTQTDSHNHSVGTSLSQRHTHTLTAGLTCLPLATSQSHAPFVAVWNVGAAVVPGFPHFSVHDTEAACTKEVCPIKQRLSDQRPPPSLYPSPPSRHTHTGTQGCQQGFQAHHLDRPSSFVSQSSMGHVHRENWSGGDRDGKLNHENHWVGRIKAGKLSGQYDKDDKGFKFLSFSSLLYFHKFTKQSAHRCIM